VGDPSALDLARQLPGAAEQVYSAVDGAVFLAACGPILAEDVERLRAVQPLLWALVGLAARVQVAVAEQERAAVEASWPHAEQ